MSSLNPGRPFLPLVLIFLVTTVLFFVLPLQSLAGMNPTVMIVGNTVLFLATLISFSLLSGAINNNNVQVFLRMIYGSMFAKMMIVLFAALLYIGIAKKGVSKGAVFGCMFLYFVYTFVEIAIIMKLSRKKKHVKD